MKLSNYPPRLVAEVQRPHEEFAFKAIGAQAERLWGFHETHERVVTKTLAALALVLDRAWRHQPDHRTQEEGLEEGLNVTSLWDLLDEVKNGGKGPPMTLGRWETDTLNSVILLAMAKQVEDDPEGEAEAERTWDGQMPKGFPGA